MQKIEKLGDRCLLVTLGDTPSRQLTRLMVNLAGEIAKLDGVIDTVVGHRTVLVETKGAPSQTIADHVEAILSSDLDEPGVEGGMRQVAVVYDGEDLGWACSRLGISADELASIHSSQIYDVKMLGSPGFIYLSEVNERIALPRMETPRKAVQAGAVGIGGSQTGIYGMSRPGGWRLIGRALEIPEVVAGDQIRFLPA